MSADRYDFIITYDSTAYNYMLRQRGETKDFLTSDAPLTPQTLITESASPTNLQPERQIQVSQVDWRKGFQDEMLEDDQKYYDSENCDARFKGEVILSPKEETAISFGSQPSVPSLTDGALENWTGNDLDSWTESGTGTLTDNTTNEQGGDHCAKLEGNGTKTLTQTISWSNNYRGNLFTLTGWGYRTASNGYVKLTINDGVGSTTSSEANDTDDTWQQGTVSRRLDGAATQLVISVEIDAETSEYTYTDTIALTATAWAFGAVPQKGIVEFGDDLLAASGNTLFNITTGSAVIVGCFPKAITNLCVYKNILFIAQGWDDESYSTTDLSTFTECVDTTGTAKHMAAIGSTALLISNSNSTVMSSATGLGTGDDYSTATQIGSDDHDITGLVDHLDTWYVRKEDDAYYVSGSDVLSLADLDTEYSTTYTYGLHRWGDNLYIGSGVNSLYEYDISAATTTDISPVNYAQGDANYDEDIIAICHDESYLYIAMDNGSDIRILAGRWENISGDTDWYWHPIYTLSSANDITCMLISSLSGAKLLYVGTDTYGDGIQNFQVPVGYAQPYSETGFDFQASGTFYTPWYRGSFPTESKYWKSVDFTSICCTSLTSITPSYRTESVGWTALTALTTSTYSGGYPSETTDSRDLEVSAKRIQFKFAMAAANTAYTPILYGTGGGIVAYATLEADKKRQITATIELAKKIRLRDLNTEDRVIATDLANLRTIYEAGGEITITAPDETTYDCVFARDGYSEQLAYDKRKRREVWWCTLQLLEV